MFKVAQNLENHGKLFLRFCGWTGGSTEKRHFDVPRGTISMDGFPYKKSRIDAVYLKLELIKNLIFSTKGAGFFLIQKYFYQKEYD